MHTNALIDEKSPYLRQHAHNPVNWLPWGETAFGKARTEQKPIFLSIGYSTCHWCHVMAHESFEDEQVAAVLNRDFVPIKLDREERPDVDRIYMLFVQATTGSGGWPMSVWLTPELKPFFGGTYFPPDSRYGRPGFKEVLEQVAHVWSQERERVELSGSKVADQLQEIVAGSQTAGNLDSSLFAIPFQHLRRMFDSKWGGFGNAPKFPRPVALSYLLRFYAAERNEEALEMVIQTLHRMAAGGMHDQIGGGFHRYSVDERWFVPHFEKMLYDQAQLAISYLEGYQITRDERLAEVARDIFGYVLRDLRDEGGGFYSAEDADSPNPAHPGHSGEGAFYIWTEAEIVEILDAETAAVFNLHFGVEPDGNVEHDPQGEFTGRNILYEAVRAEEAGARFGLNREQTSELIHRASRTLFEVRAKRPRPHLDDKILTSWNALMISALARGYAVLGNEQYKEAAQAAMEFLLKRMYDPASKVLLRRFCEGEAAIEGFLDDHAFLAQALLDLFEITSETMYLETASDLVNDAFPRFEDTQAGGFYSTAANDPHLMLRIKDDYDGAEPSGNSIATSVLVRLAHLIETQNLEERAARSLRAMAGKMMTQPTAAPEMFCALGRWLAAPAHTVIRCEAIDEHVRELLNLEWKRFQPNVVTIAVPDYSAQALSGIIPLLHSLDRKGAVTIYHCENFSCALPQTIP